MTPSPLLQLHPNTRRPNNRAQWFNLHAADISEGVSELFRLRLILREKPIEGPALRLPPGVEPPPPSAEFDLWSGEEVAAEVLAGDTPQSRRLFHGVVTEYQPDGSEAVILTLMPRLAWFGQGVRMRTFVNRHVGDVIRQVLDECKVDYRFSDKLTKREILTQYRESDAGFVLRLIAENQLCFVFEHFVDRHVMFIGESPRMHLPAGAAALNPAFRLHQRNEGFTAAVLRWQPRRASRAGQLEHQQVGTATGEDPPVGTTEQTHCSRTIVDAAGTHLVRPGELLIGPGAGSDNQFTVIRVQHSIQAGLTGNTAGYFNSFTTAPNNIGFVAGALPRPCVDGARFATVVAVDGTTNNSGTVALLDGRVWVRFDEDTAPNPKVPVRLATGLPNCYGSPRVGQRVVIDYEDGDPDRPFIVAMAPAPTTNAMPHDPERWPAAYTVRFPPAKPTGNKDDDAIVQVHDARVVVKTPGGLFAQARKLLSLIGLGGFFARAKTIVLTADQDVIVKGSKISILAGGCRIVMDGTDIAIDCPGKIFLAGGGPSASSAAQPGDDGEPH